MGFGRREPLKTVGELTRVGRRWNSERELEELDSFGHRLAVAFFAGLVGGEHTAKGVVFDELAAHRLRADVSSQGQLEKVALRLLSTLLFAENLPGVNGDERGRNVELAHQLQAVST